MTTALITGGSGNIATMVRPLLAEAGWTVHLLDVTAPRGDLAPNERAFVGSLLDSALLAEACAGVDIVVHFAAHSRERPWSEILSLNIDGTQHIFEAAHAAGVRRVLYASSIHAVGFVPLQELNAHEVLVPRPDGYYGYSKAIGESMGSLYADRFGMSVVSVRFGNVSMNMLDELFGRLVWLSAADATRLIQAVAALEAPGHHIIWGVSLNAEDFIPLDPGRRIGFEPRDDARLPGDADIRLDVLAGGEFTIFPLGGKWGETPFDPPAGDATPPGSTPSRVKERDGKQRWRQRR